MPLMGIESPQGPLTLNTNHDTNIQMYKSSTPLIQLKVQSSSQNQ